LLAGDLLARQGSPAKARKVWQDIVKSWPDRPEARDAAARLKQNPEKEAESK
jgi:TolA-binding protein